MMPKLYMVKYRAPGRILWRKVKGVVGDGIYEDRPIRFIQKADDTLINIPLESEVIFGRERAAAVEQKMSRDAGQPVQRA